MYGKLDNLNDISNKLCVPNKTEDLRGLNRTNRVENINKTYIMQM